MKEFREIIQRSKVSKNNHNDQRVLTHWLNRHTTHTAYRNKNIFLARFMTIEPLQSINTFNLFMALCNAIVLSDNLIIVEMLTLKVATRWKEQCRQGWSAYLTMNIFFWAWLWMQFGLKTSFGNVFEVKWENLLVFEYFLW